MFFAIKMLFFIYICIGQVSFLIAAKVKVFDIGQGNAVAIQHGPRVVVIDVGSSKYTHGAFQQEHASSGETEFPIVQKATAVDAVARGGSTPAKRPRMMAPSSKKSEDPPVAATAVSSEGEESIPSSLDEDGVGDDPKSHKDAVVEDIKEFIWQDGITRIDFIGTHSDKDHVGGNYLRDILLDPLLEKLSMSLEKVSELDTNQLAGIKAGIPIKNIVLGGIKTDYNADTLSILETLQALGTEVIYTGSYDGQGNPYLDDFSTPWGTPNGYARSYSSFFPDPRSDTETKIESILNFGDTGLSAKILAMNAGFSQAGPGMPAFIQNPDPNVNSMVLRFTMEDTGGASFLISGDAEHPTWAFIHAMRAQHSPQQNLETDYFLVSHHGSKENGATSTPLLGLFNPKVFLLSSGAMYNHPSWETLDLISSHLKMRSLQTGLHDITYYRKNDRDKFEYHRKTTDLPIFSTITGGTLTFTLDPPKMDTERMKKVTTSRQKVPTFTEGDQTFFPQEIRVFSSDEQRQSWIQRHVRGAHLWEVVSKKTPSADRKENIRPLVVAATSGVLPMNLASDDAAAADEGEGPDRIKIGQDIVLREKSNRGTKKWIAYVVDPIVEDPSEAVAGASGGAAAAASD
ncbi:MAG TPA: hypothetical protein PLY23_00295 [Alphaproteobacteria bacterium]|nr:hypothetical protein [Alphaproteobacteria bacterium]HQS94682.1 hypothetical protein [Alphaproteobacteria bacterium]